MIIGAVAVVVTGGGTAAAFAAFAPATVTDQIRCYSRASLDGGDDNLFGTSAAQATAADGSKTVIPAAEVCSTLWRYGLLAPDSRGAVHVPSDAEPTRSAPPLVACALRNGIAAVFPGDDNTCTALCLPRLAE
ncbi:hypothetical protein [Frankia sp. QA3]|uniref:hypothetical protein n=1 Tax=Frankia sp. QA3 TaxID=710111 RepID=UPI000269D0A4|nr:hypothetical protein [Frankia sp. QA3]EIV95432.1 hypothetical protein FraQA3DRAFT_5257 [Frankia sp. QA3]